MKNKSTPVKDITSSFFVSFLKISTVWRISFTFVSARASIAYDKGKQINKSDASEMASNLSYMGVCEKVLQ